MNFEYKNVCVKNLEITNQLGQKGKVSVATIKLDGEAVLPTKRFMKSFKQRFKIDTRMTRLFSWDEIFNRIMERMPEDQFRITLERPEKGPPRLLGATNIGSPLLQYNNLLEILEQHNPVGKVQYSDGIIRSPHAPAVPFSFEVGGDKFASQYVIDAPIDGYGKPQIHLSLLREVCSNGMVAYSPQFRSEIALGKGETDVSPSLVRALESYNNEEGYLGIRDRIESSQTSWASLREVIKAESLIRKIYGGGQLNSAIYGLKGDDEIHPLQRFSNMIGNINEEYGVTSFEQIPKKMQSKLPVKATVYDVLNFVTEMSTYDATASGAKLLQAFVGTLLSNEYDLEGTALTTKDHRDLWLHDKSVAEATGDVRMIVR